jgi:zinc and cadmium transporter
MTLAAIVAATLAGGALSIAAAALVAYRVLHAWIPRLVAFAAGMLLGVALLDLLPHAAEDGLDLRSLFATVLVGLVGFFILEKFALWRHAHPGEASSAANARHPAGALILIGDGVHNFVDGVLIAAAFIADPWLGLTTALAVMAHEIPQEVGDFLVLIQSGYSRREALAWNAVSSLMAIVGGLVGYFALTAVQDAIPYAIALCAAGFLYIATADLIPMLQRVAAVRSAVAQVAMMLLGIGLAMIPVHTLH